MLWRILIHHIALLRVALVHHIALLRVALVHHAALLWVAAAALTGNDARSAWRIWRRDRHCHASPNSAQTESACAGALGVQLAGPAYYFGEYYNKPTIGDPLRPVMPEDILKANRMMYAESILALVLGLLVRAAFVLL